jgi:NADPH-dependent curcumin reductase CurA
LKRSPRRVVLAARPRGMPVESDFRVEDAPVPAVGAGQLLCENLYLSLDAGFRNWMDEGSGDNVLPAMRIGAPVMGLALSRVVESRHPKHRVGDLLMARLAWEELSLTDGGDFLVPVPPSPKHPLSFYLGVLGDTGLSAYFGLNDYGDVKAGETVLVSAAGGAVGSVAGQIARLLGARTVGVSSGAEKCRRLVSELGYDAALDRLAPGFDAELARACPAGVDVYFDNVGGPLLQSVLAHINVGARILMCGAVASYNAASPLPGPNNLFQIVTKQARMQGFMTHLSAARYEEARAVLSGWIDAGKLRVPEYRLDGIESTPKAFCDLFRGANFGKTVVRLAAAPR